MSTASSQRASYMFASTRAPQQTIGSCSAVVKAATGSREFVRCSLTSMCVTLALPVLPAPKSIANGALRRLGPAPDSIAPQQKLNASL